MFFRYPFESLQAVTENVSSEYLEKIEKIRSDSSKNHASANEEPIGIHNQG